MLAVQYFTALRGSVFIWLFPDAFAVFSFVIVFLNLSYTRWIIINVQRVYGLCFVLDFINIKKKKIPKQSFNRFRIYSPIDNTFSFSSIADLSDDWNLPASLFFFWGGRGVWVCISCLETACSTAFTSFSLLSYGLFLHPCFCIPSDILYGDDILSLNARLYPCLITHGLFFFYCLDLSLQSLLKCQTLSHLKHFIVLRNQFFLLWNFLWSIACLFTLRHLQSSLFSGWLSHFHLHLNVWI